VSQRCFWMVDGLREKWKAETPWHGLIHRYVWSALLVCHISSLAFLVLPLLLICIDHTPHRTFITEHYYK